MRYGATQSAFSMSIAEKPLTPVRPAIPRGAVPDHSLMCSSVISSSPDRYCLYLTVGDFDPSTQSGITAMPAL